MLRALFGLMLCIAASSICFAQADSLCDEKIFDDGTIVNAFYMVESTAVMARRFEGSFGPVGMEWGEINTLSFGEPFYPWPDTGYDPVEITIWEEEPGTGFPKYPPIWTTVVTPSDSPTVVRVYPPDTILAATNIIFLGMRNPLAPDRAEALDTDNWRHFGGTIWSRDGGLTWEEQSFEGDWHIRACLIYLQGIAEDKTNNRISIANFRLFQNSPNPCTEFTIINYQLPEPTHTTLRIYDTSGRMLKTLVDGQMESGHHRAHWNGRDGSGNLVPSGVYFYQIKAGDYTAAQKLLMVR